MCRNIKTLYNFEPPATDEEIRASALQFVRKVSGSTSPSKANGAAFNEAVEEVTAVVHRLFDQLVTSATPKDRETESSRRASAPKSGSAPSHERTRTIT